MKQTVITTAKDANLGMATLNKIVNMETEDDRVYAYINAETIVDSFMTRERDSAVSMIRAEALMKEKREIMGDLWNAHLLSVPVDMVDKWYKFLGRINELGKKGQQSDSIIKLLRFANYTETTKLKGIKIVAPNEKQLTKLIECMNKKRKKGTKIKGMLDAVVMYSELAKDSNGGNVFNRSQDVVDAFESYHEPKKVKPPKTTKAPEEPATESVNVYVRDIFVEQVGDCPEAKYAPSEFPRKVTSAMPNVTKEEWKHFVVLVSDAIHPDKGGTDIDQSILNSFREMMKVVTTQIKSIDERDQWEDDYSQWKEDHGYEADFVSEDEL